VWHWILPLVPNSDFLYVRWCFNCSLNCLSGVHCASMLKWRRWALYKDTQHWWGNVAQVVPSPCLRHFDAPQCGAGCWVVLSFWNLELEGKATVYAYPWTTGLENWRTGWHQGFKRTELKPPVLSWLLQYNCSKTQNGRFFDFLSFKGQGTGGY